MNPFIIAIWHFDDLAQHMPPLVALNHDLWTIEHDREFLYEVHDHLGIDPAYRGEISPAHFGFPSLQYVTTDVIRVAGA